MLVVRTTLNCGTVSRFTVLILFALFVSKYYLNRGFYLPLLSITACLMPDMQCLLTSVRCPVVISLKLSKTDPLALWNTISKFAVLILLPHTYPPEPSPRLAPPLREISGFKWKISLASDQCHKQNATVGTCCSQSNLVSAVSHMLHQPPGTLYRHHCNNSLTLTHLNGSWKLFFLNEPLPSLDY